MTNVETTFRRYTLKFPMLQPPSPLLEMASLRLPDSEEFDVETRRRSNNGNMLPTTIPTVPPGTGSFQQIKNDLGDYLNNLLVEAITISPSRSEGAPSMEEQTGLFNASKTANISTIEQLPDRLYRHSMAMSAVYCVAYVLVFVVGLIGNSFVIAVVYRSPRMRTVTNFFIVNLAVADVLVIVFCLPATLMSNIFVPWFLGWFMCKAVAYIQGVSVAASVYSLVAVSLDRYVSAVLAAILAVAVAAPGGLTGIAISPGTGPIHAPQVVSAAVPVAAAHVVAQPVAPVVHQTPIVTRTTIASTINLQPTNYHQNNQPTNQPTNQSTNQPTNQPTNCHDETRPTPETTQHPSHHLEASLIAFSCDDGKDHRLGETHIKKKKQKKDETNFTPPFEQPPPPPPPPPPHHYHTPTPTTHPPTTPLQVTNKAPTPTTTTRTFPSSSDGKWLWKRIN
ncbi:hypothetical protein HZH66_011345 [Vespula vulgaris]|uniref:G-protein coupled receptors family 1 profile domain-containing protein n=1 Tax=Vespula vulgaris TaxID=7454 RepID=A0A834JE09_VESVU|nr:hypothetical protein HZH66_011345 [Vespula vulgaris]